jgi:hypothetical protein
VVRKGTRVLNETGAPIVLRGLLDGRAVELSAVADTKVDTIAVELRLVGERSRSGAISWGRGI